MPHLARLYDFHAEDCARAAEQTDNPGRRAMLIKLVDEWRKAAQELRQPQEQPPSVRPQAKARQDRSGRADNHGKANYRPKI